MKKSGVGRLCSLAVVSLLLLMGTGPGAWAEAEQCASCHQVQVNDWQQSHHFHAMGVATADSVLGNFKQQALPYQDAEATFARRDQALFITMPDLDGKPTEYRVTHSFGYHPLQQYMFEMSPGKFQFFPFAWDSREKAAGGQRWFVLHPEQGPTDEFHWSQIGQNWNHMCADCHSTDFRKGFDSESHSYQSQYSAINVSCAACHGDSGAHLQWAGGDKSVPNKGYKTFIGAKTPLFLQDGQGLMRSIAELKPSRQIEVCAGCHARRTQLEDRGAPDDFQHTFQPALITAELYHADGQIWDEDYVWGSFLQSKMHEAGVTCTNCHNPHSGQLKLPGNQVCTQCHQSERYDAPAHHGHKLSGAGSFCVDCHMPATTYMQVDDRRDHAFKVPRPDLTQSLGVPNACNGCHTDKTPAWAEQQMRQWHPDSQYLGREHFASAFHGADTGQDLGTVGQELTKIAQDMNYPDIIRASALYRMDRTPGRNAVVAIARALRDDDPLKRQGAITAASVYPVPDQWRLLESLLDDPHKPIRAEAGRALARMLVQPPETSLADSDKARLKKALQEYRDGQRYQADRGFSHTNLGNLEQQLGRLKNAEKHYQKAIDIEPVFIPAYVNLADLYRLRGDEAKARGVLDKALAINPNADSAHYAKAMSFVRSGDKEAALVHLQKAAQGAPPNSRFIYTYALLLQDLGKMDQALSQLQKAYALSPNDPDISYSLSQSYQASGDDERALFYAKRLGELVPGNAQIEQMIKQLERQTAAD